MRIAFHAPLKPPDHPVPSGDRQIARLLMAALRQAGHEVELVTHLRTREPQGNPERQQQLLDEAATEIVRLTGELAARPPDLWFTYHVYYKAPDLIGPEICKRLGIPYVIAEASDAPKRLEGPWADFARRARQAIQDADAVLPLNRSDEAGLFDLVAPGRLHAIPPFIRTRPRPGKQRPVCRTVRLLAIGMMRPGDKLASYRELAAALRGLASADWRLAIVGDGPVARQVRNAFAPVRNRVTWHGRVAPSRLAGIMRDHDLMVWPAVNEAFGMALVEGACMGLPTVAGRTGGVPDVVVHGRTGLLVEPHDRHALTLAIRALLRQPAVRRRMGGEAWRRATVQHGFAAASRNLDMILRELVR
ncbi:MULTISPECIES: glycosyltransferase family 4 protein [unclassified Minwuia]|uniref:glycosyltransferase family 4 protein n=1 Tax=unclassified Minwuia TaxID=2618799 RepID=UPI00247965D9|nr:MULTISPECIES: glycosyltransferase family 4 protein [unclassified Minwuia]